MMDINNPQKNWLYKKESKPIQHIYTHYEPEEMWKYINWISNEKNTGKKSKSRKVRAKQSQLWNNAIYVPHPLKDTFMHYQSW